jgi:dolichol-phosphate mannosyltransferase
MRCVSVIVPTYKEAANLPFLIEELSKLQTANQLTLELLIMDDNSQDGTKECIKKLDLPWVKLVTRTTHRGLSPAVVDGFKLAQHDTIVVMDADLSHPVEAIPKMLDILDQKYDFVIGSRYVDQASMDESWGWFRKFNSRIACLLACPLTSVKDPMSGFFAFRRTLLHRIDHLNPIGYKIGLEILVKANAHSVKEIPIHFADRKYGESKLSLSEQFKYIQHLRRLYIYRYPEWTYLSQFLMVGTFGVVINLGVLSLALLMGIHVKLSLILGIAVSLIFNFYLDRRFSFSYAKNGKIHTQFIGFVLVCLLGASINYQATVALLNLFPKWAPQLAEIVGIFLATLFNYTLSRYVIFRKKSES